MKNFNLLINGKVISAQDSATFVSINPSNGEVFANLASAGIKDMELALFSARQAFDAGMWRNFSMLERGIYLKAIAKTIRSHAKELAELECLDIGKTIKHVTFIDVPTCADCFEYFGSLSTQLDSYDNQVAAPVKSIISRDPLGVVGAIIPWNYPLIMTAWKIAPALAAGNVVILKPSSQGCAAVMALAELISKVGLPDGVLQIISTNNHDVGSLLSTSPFVDKLSFTGGTATGQDVMRKAADTNKRLTLELGGKSPNIVFADCDMEAALGGTMSAIFMNQGQMCTAGSRLLLESCIYDAFLKDLVEKTKKLAIGAATEYATDFGPIVSARHRDSILEYIQKGIEEGATLACGGGIPESMKDSKGFYIEPTILTDVDNKATVAQEEIFGPVLSVIKFVTEEDAIKLANDSEFGLASCIWSKDKEKARRVADQLQCGTVWVNTYGGFYNEAPFGGYKKSGFGRELGFEGLLEYTQTKHICIDDTPGGKPLVSNWF